MQLFVDLTGATEGSTTYADGKLVARNATFTLPEVTRLCYTQKTAGGEQDIPTGLLEDMETSITKIGVDVNSAKLANAKKLEHRWVQTVTDSEGNQKNQGCRAIMKVAASVPIPGASQEIGSTSENDHTYKVLSYALYVDGKELININKLLGINRINGEDYGIDENLL